MTASTRRRLRLIDSGICISCGQQPRDTTQRCVKCNQKWVEYQRSYRTRDNSDAATLDEIAGEIGVSRTRVVQIMATALRKLKRECRRRGIDASWVIGKPLSMLASAEERE